MHASLRYVLFINEVCAVTGQTADHVLVTHKRLDAALQERLCTLTSQRQCI
jgi:hypothetical protein